MVKITLQKSHGLWHIVPNIEQLQEDLALSPSSSNSYIDEQPSTSNIQLSTSNITYKQYSCQQCGNYFNTYSELLTHRQDCHPRGIPQMNEYSDTIMRRHCAQSAHRGSARYIRFTPLHPPIHPVDFFGHIRPVLDSTIDILLDGCEECKAQPVLLIRIHQIEAETGVILRTEQIFFSVHSDFVSNAYFLDESLAQILRQIEEFIQNGSNWIIDTVIYFDLRIVRYHSIPQRRGRCHIPLPPRLRAKKAVVNVENPGKDCFLYAVLSILHYNDVVNNRNRCGPYNKWIDELNFGKLSFPIRACDIPKLEKLNPGLFINLLEWQEDNQHYPVRSLRSCGRPTSLDQEPKVVNIMVIGEGESTHYVGVTDINRLLNSVTSSNQSRRGRKHCERCFQPFKTVELLEKHRSYCYTGRPETLVPSVDKLHHVFEKWQATQRLPYIIYADIECYLEKVDSDQVKKQHKAAAIAYLLVPHPSMKAEPLESEYHVFQGESCILQCMQSLQDTATKVYKWNKTYGNQPAPILNREEKIRHEEATNCIMCRTVFDSKSSKKRKVVEHDHLTGEYRGPTCQECNGKMRLRSTFLPVFFHNFKNYDSHVICLEALGKLPNWNVSVIAQTREKYISLDASFEIKPASSKHKAVNMTIGFRDSYQFLTTSLSNLVRNLTPEQLVHTRRIYKSEDAFRKIALTKGVFPYSYMTSLKCLKETQLPLREAFYDDLNMCECNEEDYQKAQESWQILNCKTFGDYMLSYLKLDVYQLADVFETFRNISLEQDKLDPAYYLTVPGLAWDSAFKMTGAKVDLLKDIDTYCFIEEGIRGGMTFVNKHHVVSNTPRIPEEYNPSQPETDLIYIDANNLYGNALSKKLPQSNFQWLSREDIESIDFQTFDYSDNVGHLLEVDLEYPTELQDRTEQLPFAPEKCTISHRYFTEWMQEQWKQLSGEKIFRGCSKLLLTHWNKVNYVVHGELLQFFLQKGMKLTRVHRCLQFHQSAFFEPYITFNSIQRQKAKSSFEKDYYKLRNNSLFGKTMENVRRRMKFRLSTSEESFLAYTSRPEFLDCTIFNENLTGIHLAKEQVVLNKPIFIGQAVLDISKLIMYRLFYDQLMYYAAKMGGTVEVVGGDTDSLFLQTTNLPMLLPQLCRDKLLDTSNYPAEHPLYSEECKAKLGCIKDEACGKPFKEWILLRPKAYSMLAANDKDSKKRAKGVRRATLVKEITHTMYKESFIQQKTFQHKQRRIGSIKHQVCNLTYKKQSLSFFEDKRAWVSANTSLPYGNHRLPTTQGRPQRKRANILPIVLNPGACTPAKQRRLV